MRRSLPCALLLAALALACDRRVEPFVPGEEPATPDLSRIFPPELAEEPPPDVPSMPPPPGGPAAPPGAAPVRGTVELAPGLSAAAGEGVLFVFARSPGGGPPLAARRFEGPRLPLAFELGPEDRMLASRPFAGPLQLSARLDGDGNATTREPGDLAGEAAAPVQPGDSGVRIVLDQRL